MWIIRKRIKKGGRDPALYLVDDMMNLTTDQSQARKFSMASDALGYVDSHYFAQRDLLEIVTVDVPEEEPAVMP